MTLPRSSFIVGYGPRGLPPYDYSLKNVARTTPVSAILEDITVWLAQLNVNIDSTQLQLAMPSIPDDFETMMRVPPSATAEEADLFNRSNEVVITTFPLGGLDGADLRRRIGFASQGAGGRTRNVSHNDTLNNILACDHSKASTPEARFSTKSRLASGKPCVPTWKRSNSSQTRYVTIAECSATRASQPKSRSSATVTRTCEPGACSAR